MKVEQNSSKLLVIPLFKAIIHTPNSDLTRFQTYKNISRVERLGPNCFPSHFAVSKNVMNASMKASKLEDTQLFLL